VPFSNINQREKHFAKHGHKVGAASPIDYEDLADAFMFGPRDMFTFECERKDLDAVRLHFVDYRFAVGDPQEMIVRTFHPKEHHIIDYHGGPLNCLKFECESSGL
jgi:hypothetical protein